MQTIARFICISLVVTCLQAALTIADKQELVDFYTATNGASWGDNTGWLSGATDPCDGWYGVVCNYAKTQVTGLNLNDNKLTGQLTDLLISSMSELILSENQITGSIPDFSGMPNLTTLSLSANLLTGSIPNFQGLNNLELLYVQANQLSGTIPNFNALPNISEIWTRDNPFITGDLPNFVGMNSLRVFKSSGNDHTGSVPDYQLPSLEELILSGNQLSGQVPNFTGMGNLIWLVLTNNQLTGTIPDFDSLPFLTYLRMNINQLTGTVPNFQDMPLLEELIFYTNQLTGTIPIFDSMPVLRWLYLYGNELTGTIPDFDNLAELDRLFLQDNQLTGTIPDLSAMTDLQMIYFNDNQLTGTIPNFSGLNNLVRLRLQNNTLTGTVPDFGNESFNLDDLNLYSNLLCGSLPTDIPSTTFNLTGNTFLDYNPGWCSGCATFDDYYGCCDLPTCGTCNPSCASCNLGVSSDICETCSAPFDIWEGSCIDFWYEPPALYPWSIYYHGCLSWDETFFPAGETGTFYLQTGTSFDTEVLIMEDYLLSTGGIEWDKIYGILPSESSRVKVFFGDRDAWYTDIFEVTIPIMEHDNPCSA